MASKNSINLDLRKVGKVLKAARENLRLSFRDLTAKCDISPTQLMRMESGEFEYSVAKFYKLCVVLGIPIGELLEYGSDRRMAPVTKLAQQSAFCAVIKDYKQNARMIAEQFAESCYLLAATILTSNDPIKTAHQAEYPSEALCEKFIKFGFMVDGFSNVERVNTFEALRQNPFNKLNSLGLCDAEMVTEHVKKERPPTVGLPKGEPTIGLPISIERILLQNKLL